MKKIRFLMIALALISFNTLAQDSKIDEYISEGIELYEEGKYKEAINAYKKALKLEPKSTVINYEIALTYFALKDYKNTVKYADAAIAGKGEDVDKAYIAKGSALDLMNKPDEAIKSYKKGIRENPDSYLIHYNLSLTYFNKGNFKEAEKSAIDAIQINRMHASSHMLLAYIMQSKGNNRAKSLLSLYHFLLLEPTGNRANEAYRMLIALNTQGVERESVGKTTISLDLSEDTDDGFQAAELMISLLEASKNIEKNEGKTEEELFYNNTESFFTILGELKDKNKGFWWEFYVEFFYEMAQAKHVEAMSYYISLPKEDGDAVQQWLTDNEARVDALFEWCNEYMK